MEHKMLSRYLPRIEFESYEDLKENYKVNVPDNFNFAYDVIDKWAQEESERPALVWIDDDLNEKRLSFGELSLLSNRAANLYKSYGIGKGDVVMLMLKQRIEVWICMIALHKIGAVCIPATFQLTPKDIVYRCNAANVKMLTVVPDNDILEHIGAALKDCPTVGNVTVVGDIPDTGYIDFRRELERHSDAFPRPTGDEDTRVTDDMLIYFSSGTTGMPKMVLHDFSYPLGHITTAKYWHKVEDKGLHLTVSDSGWAKFGWGKIYGQWICGAVIVAYDTEKFVPERLLAVVTKLKLTTFCAPPTIYRFLIKEDLSGADFSTIKHATTAGEPLNPEVFDRFYDLTGLKITEGFGQSETSVLLANFGFYDIKPGSMGKPSPLYDVDIVDENGDSCEDGIVGTIVVKNLDTNYPVGLFREYKGDKEANKNAFWDNLYSTGDTAWRDSDGYYWFVGRNDDIIKCSGYRIGPFEVESALLTHPSVLECAVTAAPDPVRGQVVKATVVLARGFVPSDELRKELQDHVKNTTAPYKYPRILEFTDALPKTISGKIKRAEIRNS